MNDMMHARALERRLLIEKTLAYLSASICLLTVVWRDWIELAFRVDPDGGNGAVEWMIVSVLAVTSVVLTTVARADRQRLRGLAANDA
jgi:hypothetical protein